MASVAGGMIAGSIIKGIGARKAAKEAAAGRARGRRATASAGKEARKVQEGYYDTTRSDFAPYLGIGAYGAQQYEAEARSGFGLPEYRQPTEADMLVDPSYQWRLNQGIEATTRALTKSGQAWGGQRGIALMDYAQNAASQEYSNIFNRSLQMHQMNYGRRTDYLNRLQGISESGLRAANSIGSIGANYAANIGSTITGTGQAVAQGHIGEADARSSGIVGTYNSMGNVAEIIGTAYGMGEGGGDGTGVWSPGGWTASTVQYT